MNHVTQYERVAAIVGALDSHTEVVFLPLIDGWGGVEHVGIVRDRPSTNGEARRVTMHHGSEFFCDAESLERMRIVGIRVKDVVLVEN